MKHHAHDRGYKPGHKHATVEVALRRALHLVHHSGIEGLNVDNRKGFRYNDQIKKGHIHFEWLQGWAATEVHGVSLTVEVDAQTMNLSTGLTRFRLRMQWAPIADTLAQRTTILELATRVNNLSARMEAELDGWFIINEETYEKHITGEAK